MSARTRSCKELSNVAQGKIWVTIAHLCHSVVAYSDLLAVHLNHTQMNVFQDYMLINILTNALSEEVIPSMTLIYIVNVAKTF